MSVYQSFQFAAVHKLVTAVLSDKHLVCIIAYYINFFKM